MSDHQPPSGTPEYLDSGGGSAVVPPRRPTREAAPPAPEPSYAVDRGGGRRPSCCSVGGACVGGDVLLPAGCAARRGAAGLDGRLRRASTSTRAAGQKIDAFRTLNKFPAFKDKVGIHSTDDVRRKIGRGDHPSLGCALDLSPTTSIPGSATGRRSRPSTSGRDARRGRRRPGQGRRQGRATPPGAITCGHHGQTDLGTTCTTAGRSSPQSQHVADQVVATTDNGSLADDATYQKWTEGRRRLRRGEHVRRSPSRGLPRRPARPVVEPPDRPVLRVHQPSADAVRIGRDRPQRRPRSRAALLQGCGGHDPLQQQRPRARRRLRGEPAPAPPGSSVTRPVPVSRGFPTTRPLRSGSRCRRAG